jgi:FkbM family methyltransferase
MLSSEVALFRSALRRLYAIAFKKVATASQQVVPPGSPLASLKKKVAGWLRPVHRRQLDVLLEVFARTYPRAVFVQIGSNDGEQQDPLSEAIRKRQWRGVMVEPVPYVFERLQRNYRRYRRLQLENVAIAQQDGHAPFYHLPKVSADEQASLPQWYDALGSFSRDIILSHKPYIPDIADRIACIEVPTVTFETLCQRNRIDHLDLVHIDTEGYDYEILKLIDFERWRPRLVIYEHHHLGAARPEAEAYLRQHGYELMHEALDTWALRVADFGRKDRDLLAVWKKLKATRTTSGRKSAKGKGVAGVDPAFADLFRFDDEEHRQLTAAYDDSMPLPPGASVYLSSNNPRLLEIRRRYAALDLPVSVRSQWNQGRVEKGVDLCYFRGDNPYIWHYRELPRATKLKFFSYMDYLQGCDHAGLFERLTEDGAFGCWTHQYPGRPRISRDLLDSINELLFLDRTLGLLKREQLRVLDIGAGYGRLAHRTCAAVPGIVDYCCVDAVAESSFLSEFYLGHRGLLPPARVVLLDEVQSNLKRGSFDLAVNVHSFSECPEAAVIWWLGILNRLEVPLLFIVPNEADGLLSTEPDGSKRDLLPAVAAAGYVLEHQEKAIADPAIRELLRIHDQHLLFRRRARGSA